MNLKKAIKEDEKKAATRTMTKVGILLLLTTIFLVSLYFEMEWFACIVALILFVLIVYRDSFFTFKK